MPAPDTATIESLRRDLALQIARFVDRLGATQRVVATQLSIPQPTLSRILNGRVANMSVELLLRIAVRAGLVLTLQTGRAPEEAGVFRSGVAAVSSRAGRSQVAESARASRVRSERWLTPAQRLETFLEHNQLLALLQRTGRGP